MATEVLRSGAPWRQARSVRLPQLGPGPAAGRVRAAAADLQDQVVVIAGRHVQDRRARRPSTRCACVGAPDQRKCRSPDVARTRFRPALRRDGHRAGAELGAARPARPRRAPRRALASMRRSSTTRSGSPGKARASRHSVTASVDDPAAAPDEAVRFVVAAPHEPVVGGADAVAAVSAEQAGEHGVVVPARARTGTRCRLGVRPGRRVRRRRCSAYWRSTWGTGRTRSLVERRVMARRSGLEVRPPSSGCSAR